MDLSRLAIAILARCDESVLLVLRESTQVVEERIFGLSVLHLCSTWPRGLNILLSSGAITDTIINATVEWNLEIGDRYTALDFALYFDCCDAIQLLLDNDCPWNRFPRGLHTECRSMESIGAIARSLASRRRRLLQLAKEKLTTNEIAKFKDIHEGVPDQYARSIVHALKKAGCSVPTALSVPETYEGIYHSGCLPFSCFPIFYEAGFRGLDSRNQFGLLPIMITRASHWMGILNCFHSELPAIHVQILPWIVEHACLDQMPTDPRGLGLNTAATGWHYFAAKLPLDLGAHPFDEREVFKPVIGGLVGMLLQRIFKTFVTDDCHCWCSLNGCSPLIVHFKSLIISRKHFLVLHKIHEQTDFIWETLEQHRAELIRLITFEALEMTHTCCVVEHVSESMHGEVQARLKNFSGDIGAIREEEEELATRLNQLVTEFQSKVNNGNDNLKNFVWSYWRTRMQEECVPSQEDIEDIRNAGVRPEENCKFNISLPI